MNYLLNKYKNLNIVFKASIWFTICSLLQRGISIITMPIFTRLMTTEQYGEYSIYVAWYNIFDILITLCIFKEVFNKGLIENKENQDAFTANIMGLLIFLSFIFTVFYLIFSNLFIKFTGLPISYMLLMILEISSNVIIALWLARKRFIYDYKKVFFITLLISLSNPLIGLILLFIFKNKVLGRIVSATIIPLIVSIILMYIYLKKGSFFSKKNWIYALKMSLPLLPHYLSLVLLNQTDKIMIKQFIGSSEAAIYSIAHSAGLLMVLVSESLNNAFVPWAYNKLKNKKSIELKKMINPILLIVLYANVLLIWFSPECIYLLAAPQYHVAIWCIFPIAMSVYCSFVYTLFVDIEIYYRGNVYVTMASIIASIINIILNLIFIPSYGYVAAAYTTLFSYFITMLFHYIFMNRVLKKNEKKQDMFNFGSILAIFALFVAISIVGVLLYKYTILRIIIFCFTTLIIFINKKNIIKVLKTMKKNKGENL